MPGMKTLIPHPDNVLITDQPVPFYPLNVESQAGNQQVHVKFSFFDLMQPEI